MSALFAFAFAKPTPDVSEGYAYPTPASSYGVPLNSRLSGDNIAQVLPSSFSASLPFAPSQAFQLPSAQVVSFAPVVSTTPSTLSVSYEQPSFASVVSSTPAPVFSSFNAGFPSASVVSSGFPSASFGSKFSSGFSSGSSDFSSGFSSSANSQFSSSSSSNAAAQVTKNLYFFAAPEEPEEPIRPRINVQQAPAQKNYKIIFIKTPEFRQSVVNVPVVSQNEEKTVVYVLVKRPEEPQVNVQASSASKPAKPEVFFIKYKTKEEAEEAINQAQQGNFAGISANAVENSGFVESLNGASSADAESVSIGGDGSSSSAQFVSGDSSAAAPLVSLNVGSTPASFVAVSESSTAPVEVPTVTTLDADSGFVQNVVVSSEERSNTSPSSSGGVSVSFVSSTPFPVYGPPGKRSVKKQ